MPVSIDTPTPPTITLDAMMRSACLLLVSSAAFTCCALAQTKSQAQPQPVPMPPAIVAPLDKPYLGPIELSVDLTDIMDRVERVHEDIPVEPGAKEMVLLYPRVASGRHEPSGPIESLGGIVTSVDGKRVQWVRDRVNVYAFHVPLTAEAKTVGPTSTISRPLNQPQGASKFLTPSQTWNGMKSSCIRAGYFSRDIPVDTTLKLPPDGNMLRLETSSVTGDAIISNGPR